MSQEKENTQEVIQDLFATHGYTKGQQLTVGADFIIGVVNFCRRVIDSQPNIAALTQYPKKVNEIRDEKGELVRVDIEWENHTKQSFANTAFSENGGVSIVPDLAVYAYQIENALLDMHIKNINDGVAKSVEELIAFSDESK